MERVNGIEPSYLCDGSFHRHGSVFPTKYTFFEFRIGKAQDFVCREFSWNFFGRFPKPFQREFSHRLNAPRSHFRKTGFA